MRWRQFLEEIGAKSEQEKFSFIRQKKALALDEIEKIIDVKSFIIKKQALKKLIKFKNDLQEIYNIPDEEGHYEIAKKSINRCLSDIKKIAKSDLETIIDKIFDSCKNLKSFNN